MEEDFDIVHIFDKIKRNNQEVQHVIDLQEEEITDKTKNYPVVVKPKTQVSIMKFPKNDELQKSNIIVL